MSDIVANVIQHLLTVTDVRSKLAEGDDGTLRIHPTFLPEAREYPAIRVQLPSGDSDECLTGATGLATDRVQIDCFARTHLEASALRESVRMAMQGYHGPMGDTAVRSCMQVGKYDLYSDPRDGDADGVHMSLIEFEIAHSEAIPSF